MAHDEEKQERPSSSPPLLEWLVAGLGVVLVFGTVGFMTYRAVTTTQQPPTFDFTTEQIESVGEDYLVKVRVLNNGTSTAASVQIEGELLDGEAVIETSEVTLDYIPAYSEVYFGLFFTEDPAQYTLDLRAAGFEEP